MRTHVGSVCRAAIAAAISIVLPAAPSSAAPLRVTIARLQSQQSCTTYQMSSGRSAVTVGPYAASASSNWRTWLVRDCADNFATIRATLQAALTAGLDHDGQGGTYMLSGIIATLGTESSGVAGDGYDARSDRAAVTFSFVIRNAAGTVVYGGTIVKTIDTAATIRGSEMAAANSVDGQAIYTRLENAVSAAVARAVLFHLDPLIVIGAQGQDIELNYGTPLLDVGTMIQARSVDGRALRYVVSSASRGQATAEPDGEHGDIAIGREAIVVEPEGAAANARRYHRVDLP